MFRALTSLCNTINHALFTPIFNWPQCLASFPFVDTSLHFTAVKCSSAK